VIRVIVVWCNGTKDVYCSLLWSLQEQFDHLSLVITPSLSEVNKMLLWELVWVTVDPHYLGRLALEWFGIPNWMSDQSGHRNCLCGLAGRELNAGRPTSQQMEL
jgi:hypothetical protein